MTPFLLLPGCPSFKFLTMQMLSFRILCAYLDRLSATIMFADKPATASTNELSRSDFVLWALLRQPTDGNDVCLWGYS